jgi:hypothetical protein
LIENWVSWFFFLLRGNPDLMTRFMSLEGEPRLTSVFLGHFLKLIFFSDFIF